MVEPHSAQQYMMVTFNFDLFEIGFPHYIRNEVKHKIWGYTKPVLGACILRIPENVQNYISKTDITTFSDIQNR